MLHPNSFSEASSENAHYFAAKMINFSAQHHLLIEQSLFVYIKNTDFCCLKVTLLETQTKHSHSPVKVRVYAPVDNVDVSGLSTEEN